MGWLLMVLLVRCGRGFGHEKSTAGQLRTARHESRHEDFMYATSPQHGRSTARLRPCPGRRSPAGARVYGYRVRQLSEPRAAFQVADGRMTASALAFSGW
ncbi:hypothetical protein GCM10017776_58690 [Streptomyces griseoluteus]|nr:hypothetical protein GCM10017776_58690 [Streptomyces griseoluteus]